MSQLFLSGSKSEGFFYCLYWYWCCIPIVKRKGGGWNHINWIRAQVFDWQHICYVWWTYLSTDSRHYLWVQTVLLFSATCSFTRMRHNSYKGFSRKTKRSYPILWFHVPLYRRFPMCNNTFIYHFSKTIESDK
jgi:hypothetical protein